MVSTLEHIATLLIPLFNFSILVILLFISRRWTGPAQDVRMEMLEDQQKALRGNFYRFERDTTANLRTMQECLQNILTEVQVIRQAGAKEHPLAEEVRELRERVMDVEQSIHGLPCGQILPEACPAKE